MSERLLDVDNAIGIHGYTEFTGLTVYKYSALPDPNLGFAVAAGVRYGEKLGRGTAIMTPIGVVNGTHLGELMTETLRTKLPHIPAENIFTARPDVNPTSTIGELQEMGHNLNTYGIHEITLIARRSHLGRILNDVQHTPGFRGKSVTPLSIGEILTQPTEDPDWQEVTRAWLEWESSKEIAAFEARERFLTRIDKFPGGVTFLRNFNRFKGARSLYDKLLSGIERFKS